MITSPVATVMYAQAVDRLARFYEQVLGAGVSHREPTHSVLRGAGIELVLHALPPEWADAVHITTPPQVREDTPIKPVFTVASLAQARAHAAACGGQVLPAEREWRWGAWRVCNAIDPEGNVIQLREPAPVHALQMISSKATQALLNELVGQRQAAMPAPKLVLESVGGVDAARRVAAGEPFDVVVLARDAINQLVAAGHLVPGSVRDVVHSGVAVAVRAGDAAPDLSSAAALKQAVQGARSIGYSTGPSGTALAKLFEHWGLADVVRAKLVVPPPGVPVGRLVASGEVALGFQQLSELMGLPGIQVVGPLPAEVQITTTFSAAVASTSEARELAAAVVAFLADPAHAATKQRNGMSQPVA